LRLDLGGLTGGSGASSTSDTGLGGVSGGGVVRIEPEHLGGVVVPDGEDEDHSLCEGLGHSSHTAVSGERVGIAEEGLLGRAERVGDGVVGGETGECGEGVGDDLAILDVEAADLREGARGGVVVGDELRDDGELGGGIDELARAVERLVTHTEGVEVTTIGVTDTVVAGGDGAVLARAASLTRDGTGMGSVGG